MKNSRFLTHIKTIHHRSNFIFLILSISMLNGCLNYYQEVTLYPDGSGKMKIDYWMKFTNEESKKVVDNLGIFNTDSIRSGFQSAYSIVDNVSVYGDSTDSSTHALVDLSFDHIDSLNKTHVFSEYEFSFVEKENGQVIFNQFIPPIATGFGVDASKFTVKYIYSIPGEILSHNAEEVNGRRLTWEYNLAEIGGGKTISVTFQPYKLKETPSWIYYLSGAVLFLVLFFLLKKRKS